MRNRNRTLSLVVGAIALCLVWLGHALTTGNASIISTADRSPTTRNVPGKPATRPASLIQGTILSTEYSILSTHSIFCPSIAAAIPPVGPDAGFVFKGAIQVGEGFTAFVEDMVGKRVIQVAAGDAVARGHIKSIDIDSIEYVVASNTLRVTVGQTLEAVDFQMKPATQPAGGGAPGSDGQNAPAGAKGPASPGHGPGHKGKPPQAPGGAADASPGPGENASGGGNPP